MDTSDNVQVHPGPGGHDSDSVGHGGCVGPLEFLGDNFEGGGDEGRWVDGLELGPAAEQRRACVSQPPSRANQLKQQAKRPPQFASSSGCHCHSSHRSALFGHWRQILVPTDSS